MQPSAIRLTFNPVRPRRVYSTARPSWWAGTSLGLSPAPHHSTGAPEARRAVDVAFEDIGAPARGAVSLDGPSCPAGEDAGDVVGGVPPEGVTADVVAGQGGRRD